MSGDVSVVRESRPRVFLAHFLRQAHMSIAFGDQALVSAVNFLCGVILARFLGLHEFGRFGLAWMVAEFAASMQFAAVIQPMLNIGPKQPPDQTESYLAAVKMQQGIFGLGAALIVLIAAALLSRIGPHGGFGSIALPLAFCVVAYQAHAFVRRYLFLRRRPGMALFVDVIRFGLQLGGTVAVGLLSNGLKHAATALWIVAISAAIGALPGFLLLGNVRPGIATLVAVTRRHWNFSKWLMPSALMYWMSGQTLFIVAGIVLGASAVGALNVATAMAGILNILLLALDNFASARAAHAVHTEGTKALYRYIRRLAAGTALVALTVITALNINPEHLVQLIYGNKYEGIGLVIRFISLAYFPYAMSAVLVLWAAAIERTKTIFVSQAAAAAFSVLAAYPLAYYGGLRGIAFGALLGELFRIAYLFTALWKSRNAPIPSHATPVHAEVKAKGTSSTAPSVLLTQTALKALSVSGIPRLLAHKNSGIGGILAMHRVHEPTGDFEFGTRRASISPANFRRVITTLMDQKYDFLTMSQVAARIGADATPRKFVCLTFDDGFVDSYTQAFPICRSFGVPMVVYLVSGIVNRSVPMWWLGLDRLIAENDAIEFCREGKVSYFPIATPRQKRRAYFRLANWLAHATPQECRDACDLMGKRYAIDFMELTDRNALTAEMIAEMQASGLVEFGAHTVTHTNLRGLCAEDALREIADSVREIETITKNKVCHFAYPYGASDSAGPREFAMCRDLGLETAVTTRMANVFPADRDQMHALPRLTLNGDYQDGPLLELLMSGALPRIRQVVGDIRSTVAIVV